MSDIELSLGIVIGIVLTSVVGLAKEIIIREYNAKRDNSLRIKNIQEDLKADIKTLCAIWENYKISESMHKEFRSDMEYQTRRIIEVYTAFAKDLDTVLIDDLREVCSKFIKLIETASEIGDNVWFRDMEREGDELCEEFDKIVQDKF